MRRDERGFVLSLVIFAVAALSIAGTALFLVVQSETAMAESGAESATAFHLANAGLARYMGESFGEPEAEKTYEMGGGTVTVTAERALSHGDTTEVYLIRSEAVVPDRRVPDLVSRRSVQQLATLRRMPLDVSAALTVASSNVSVQSATLEGRDQCPGGRDDVAEIAALESVRPHSTNVYPSYEALLASIGLDWDAMNDSTLPFDYELPGDAWPNFETGQIAPDDYPTIRYDGDFYARSGRGLLVVTGRISFGANFAWDGLILAGSVNSTNEPFSVTGALVTGFDDAQNSVNLKNADISYNSCSVAAAAAGIALFSPIPNTWWESAD